MSSIDEIYKSSSNWLAASDLQGKEIPVTIDHSKVEEVGGDPKVVVYFSGKEKGLALNKTNARTIGDAYGKDYTHWGSKDIVMYPARVDFQGRMVDAIRVRIPTAQALDDEIPF